MRSCGDCHLCCKLLKIKSLQKEEGRWCEHWDKEIGCKINEAKPEECQRFACLWLSELIPEELSPRKTGVVAWATKEQRIMINQNKGAKLHLFRNAIAQWSVSGIDVGIVRQT
jgi:hypothetical protein